MESFEASASNVGDQSGVGGAGNVPYKLQEVYVKNTFLDNSPPDVDDVRRASTAPSSCMRKQRQQQRQPGYEEELAELEEAESDEDGVPMWIDENDVPDLAFAPPPPGVDDVCRFRTDDGWDTPALIPCSSALDVPPFNIDLSQPPPPPGVSSSTLDTRSPAHVAIGSAPPLAPAPPPPPQPQLAAPHVRGGAGGVGGNPATWFQPGMAAVPLVSVPQPAMVQASLVPGMPPGPMMGAPPPSPGGTYLGQPPSSTVGPISSSEPMMIQSQLKMPTPAPAAAPQAAVPTGLPVAGLPPGSSSEQLHPQALSERGNAACGTSSSAAAAAVAAAAPAVKAAPFATAPSAPHVEQLANGLHRVFWTVDTKKLRQTDKQFISPTFTLALGGPENTQSVPFTIMLFPATGTSATGTSSQGTATGNKSTRKGGGSFARARGRGHVRLKCQANLVGLEADAANMHLRLAVTQPDRAFEQAMCNITSHDFAENAVCMLRRAGGIEEEWDLYAPASGELQGFLVVVELAAAASPSASSALMAAASRNGAVVGEVNR